MFNSDSPMPSHKFQLTLLVAALIFPKLVLASEPKAPVYECVFTISPVQVDGFDNDDSWKQANLLPPFLIPNSGAAPMAGTKVKLAWDLDYFYFYAEMSDKELLERQEFAFEAAIRMRDRFLQQEVWERHGVNPKDVVPLVLHDPTRKIFQQMLFAKIVPNSKKLGLLDRNNSWLRRRFEEMDVIQFEDLEDTGSEYEQYQLN